MSEKPKEKPWQQEVREQVEAAIEDYAKRHQKQIADFDNLSKTLSPPGSESKVEHKTVQDLSDCPNCRKEYKVDEYDAKVKAKTQEEFVKALKERGSLGYECVGCGTGETETEARDGECPHCHGKTARRRS